MKMKTQFLTTILFTGSLFITHASPADDVATAAQKLGNGGNYSWHTTVAGPAGSPLSPGPIDGKIKRVKNDLLLYLKRNPVQNPLPDAQFSNLTLEILARGTNIVINDPDPDGGWQTLADFTANDLAGPGRFVSQMLRYYLRPDDQADELLRVSANLAPTDGGYAGDLSPDAAKKLLADGNSTVSNASGTVQFWISGGELTKFEYKVEGTSGDNSTPIKCDTTVEIQNVGTTTINVPADAKKLLP
jgi:hypothetical protein